jgi:hypothetical protein
VLKLKDPLSSRRALILPKREVDSVIFLFSASRGETVARVARGCGSRPGRTIAATPVGSRSRRRGNRVIKVGESLSPQGAHDAFESPDHVVVFGCDERERVASALGAPCAPDAVDVRVGSVGHIVVDHV